MTDDLKITLPLYEGPLDLLLDMIRKQKIDVYDIPIARITEQYLEYLRFIQELNIDVAGEFIFMAAQLIYIKSRRSEERRVGQEWRGRWVPGYVRKTKC